MRAPRRTGLRVRQIDLATPYEEEQAPPPEQVHVVQKPVEDDATVAQIAAILVAGYAVAKAAELIWELLKPYGIPLDAVQAVLSMTGTDTGEPDSPRAERGILRFNADGSLNEGGPEVSRQMLRVSSREAYYRAAYIANAAKRVWKDWRRGETGKTLAEAIESERRFWEAHRAAQEQRVNAAAQVQTAANMWGAVDNLGTLIGWYLNPLLNNETECKAANGHNFYAEIGTIIGYPGAVHRFCGCYAGPVHEGRGLVDDAVRPVVRFDRRTPPKFKVKKRRAQT